MEQIGKTLEWIAVGIHLLGITILLVGALKFIAHYVALEFRRLKGLACVSGIRNLRLGLGSYILLALEFMIVSDVIHTTISRDFDDFLMLGLIVAIRTTLGFFLGRELTEVKAEE